MEKKKIGTKYKVLIAVFLILFFILYGIVYVFPSIGSKVRNTYTAEYGTVSVGVETEYIVVRDEYVTYAKNNGNVQRNIEQGELVRSGTDVASVGSKSYQNEYKGVVSYYTDGLEENFTIDSIESLNKDEIGRIKALMTDDKGKEISLLSECSKGEIESGDPLFKTIDNLRWYIVIWLSRQDASKLSEGEGIRVKFDGADKAIRMNVEKIYQETTEAQVVLSSSNYYSDFDKMRIGNCEIITEERSGIVLETSSIVTSGDGTIGVYIINQSNEKVFIPINVLLSLEDKTVVSRNYFYDSDGDYIYTVKMYDTVLRK